jgi:hypothetical protein
MLSCLVAMGNPHQGLEVFAIGGWELCGGNASFSMTTVQPVGQALRLSTYTT